MCEIRLSAIFFIRYWKLHLRTLQFIYLRICLLTYRIKLVYVMFVLVLTLLRRQKCFRGDREAGRREVRTLSRLSDLSFGVFSGFLRTFDFLV